MVRDSNQAIITAQPLTVFSATFPSVTPEAEDSNTANFAACCRAQTPKCREGSKALQAGTPQCAPQDRSPSAVCHVLVPLLSPGSGGTKPPCSGTRWCDVLTVGAVGGWGHSHPMSPGHLCSPPSPDSPLTARLGFHAEIRIVQCSSPCLQPTKIQVPFTDAMDIFQHLIKHSPRGYSGQSCRIKLWMSHS